MRRRRARTERKYPYIHDHLQCFTPHASRLTPPSSGLTPHASRLTPHASRLTPHASRLTPHASLHAHHSQRSLEQRARRIGEPVEDGEVIVLGTRKIVFHRSFPAAPDQCVLLMKAGLLF